MIHCLASIYGLQTGINCATIIRNQWVHDPGLSAGENSRHGYFEVPVLELTNNSRRTCYDPW